MDEEDDYDLDDELEQALAAEDAPKGPENEKKTFLSGPGLPTGATLAGQPLDDPSSQDGVDHAPPARPSAVATSDIATATESEAEPPAYDTEPGQREREEDARHKEAMLQLMTPEQINRYEAYRRSSLNKKGMRRILQAVSGLPPVTVAGVNMTIIMCGVAKMFVGELMEEARAIAAAQGNFGPLRPSHVHEAYQVLELRQKVPGAVKRRRL